MQNYQKGTHVYTSYNSVDVLEWLYVGAAEGIHKVVSVVPERMVNASGQRFVADYEFNELWSTDPQEALAKCLRANISQLKEDINHLNNGTNKRSIEYEKIISAVIEYKERIISDLFETNKDIIKQFPELFL